jgi:hypothetical protein
MSTIGKAAAATRGCAAITTNLSITPPRASSAVGSNTVSSQRSHFTSDRNDDSCDDASALDDNDHYFGVGPPNKITVVYQRMQVQCPDVIKAYARCVIDKQNSGALIQNACEDEFHKVRDCFRSVR